jgi:hypothetical protein
VPIGIMAGADHVCNPSVFWTSFEGPDGLRTSVHGFGGGDRLSESSRYRTVAVRSVLCPATSVRTGQRREGTPPKRGHS